MMAAVSRIAVAAGYYSVPATNTSARLPRPHPRYTGLTMSDIDPELVPVLPPAYRGQTPPAADREMVACGRRAKVKRRGWWGSRQD